MIALIAAASCLLAVVPATLFVRNLALYRPPPMRSEVRLRCSVLIPARNEERNIAPAVRSILGSTDAQFEVIVLDDGSTDRTAQIVREIAEKDAPRAPGNRSAAARRLVRETARLLTCSPSSLRIRSSSSLTPMCGSKPDALARMSAFMEQSGAALASGVPGQETRTFSERLLIPLVHFVLLGFLPIQRMRTRREPACSAGCGQLFVALREAYHACGGHSAIRGTLHDGPKLPRVFRAAGFATDLFDATDVAVCRMYPTGKEVWRGLARNAHEALGSPRLIGPATVLLFGGQVLPLCVLVATLLGASPSPLAFALSLLGTGAAFLPRLLAVARFRQPLSGALLHPIGVCALLVIQWFAFFRSLGRYPAVWKGRTYFHAPAT